MITIESKSERIALTIKDEPASILRASLRAMNSAMKSARTVMKTAISDDTGLASGYVLRKLVLNEANRAQPRATLRSGLTRLSLAEFGGRQTKRGVTYKIGGERRSLPGAFIATMPSTGNRGVFKRNKKFGRNDNPRLERISQMYGPSLGHVFGKYRPAGLAKLQEVFEGRFDHELEYARTETPT